MANSKNESKQQSAEKPAETTTSNGNEEYITKVVAAYTVQAEKEVDEQIAKSGVKLPEATRPCACGCGSLVRRTFLPGHDAKLKARLKREAMARRATAAQAEAESKATA